ncbi:MAG: transglutaminase-like cysteine peptidase, partial [Pseudomonadota bacterium]
MILASAPLASERVGYRLFRLWLVVAALAAILLLPPYFALALDLTHLQSSFRRMSGKPQVFQDWQKLLQNSRELAVAEKLRQVNDFFNRRIEFVDDQDVWGQSDYWATPMESLSKNRGDCEDYVIAKYFSLLDLDIPNTALRLIYVKARIGGAASTLQQAHMVLAYYATPDAEPVLLDNLINGVFSISETIS